MMPMVAPSRSPTAPSVGSVRCEGYQSLRDAVAAIEQVLA
jgi:hypothetical protein